MKAGCQRLPAKTEVSVTVKVSKRTERTDSPRVEKCLYRAAQNVPETTDAGQIEGCLLLIIVIFLLTYRYF